MIFQFMNKSWYISRNFWSFNFGVKSKKWEGILSQNRNKQMFCFWLGRRASIIHTMAYPLSRFKSKRWPAVTLSISCLHQITSFEVQMKMKGYEHGTADTYCHWIKNTYLSSLRIFSISLLNFSVSCCSKEKWFPCITIPKKRNQCNI